jgi:quercetin dioxygenase-like cupin family protein
MNRLLPVLFALLQVSECAVAQEKVETVGITPLVKLEEIISGHLNELNGKFKLRVTELTFAPGASLGAHHHAGPGIRLVLSGELTFAQAGKAIVYKTGDYFYESGNVVHTAQNKAKAPLRVAFFEILPVQWSGPSLIPPKAY